MSKKNPRNNSSAAREQRQIRRIASGQRQPRSKAPPNMSDIGLHHEGLYVTGVEMDSKRPGVKRSGTVTFSSRTGRGGTGHDPRTIIGLRIQEALDPRTAPRPVKSLKDMTPEEQAEMKRLYEKK